MRLFHSMLYMFIGSFVYQYFFMSLLMTNNPIYITNSVGKLYVSIIMGLSMALIELIMHSIEDHMFSLNFYIIITSLLVLFLYLYRNQVGINDEQYLREMIEHHSMALLTSEEILKKTDNYNVAKLAKNIIQSQTDEIRTMQDLVKA